MSARLTLAVWSALALAPAAQFALPTKDVAAPPEDVRAGLFELPDPGDSAISSRALWIEVPAGEVFTTRVPVEGDGSLIVTALSAGGDARLAIAEPGGAPAAVDAWVAAGRAQRDEVDAAPGVDVRVPRIALGTEAQGEWTLRVEGASGGGALLVASGAPADGPRLVTSLSHWDLTTTGRPALRATVDRDDAVLLEATAHVTHADGARWTVAFADDGRHDDGEAGDGVLGAWLPTERPGLLDVRVDARGATLDGEFARSALHRVPLHVADVALTGAATLRPSSSGGLAVAFGVTTSDVDRPLQASAEVWGTDATGDLVPVAWLSKMTTVRGSGSLDAPVLALSLDPRWLVRAGAGEPFELRGLRVQDPDTHVPLARLARVDLDSPLSIAPARARTVAIDAQMLTGFPFGLAGAPRLRPTKSDGGTSSSSAPVPVVPLPADLERGLMLVHGYCADGNPWPVGDFTGQLIEFSDPDANRSHDAFAQLIGATGLVVDSFGVVAHSQGGPASLHLLTFYMSGLDLATGGRRIQSVGSPYQGTPLAGALASIGSVFGAGCGANTDLSTDGAPIWLAGIPSWARAEVHYYTTANDGFSACEFASSLFLSNPEDGVVERSRGQLPGGNSEGHVTGWCHTTGMSDPAQYFDTARNVFMDGAAAR